MEDRPILETPDAQHKILILDDEPAIAEPFETALQELGHDVRSTTDGKEAVKLIDLFAPDLLVTDINLPEIDILDLIAELRRSRPRLRIIAISGNSHLLKLAAQHGADHVLPKPFSVGELNALVEKLLGR